MKEFETLFVLIMSIYFAPLAQATEMGEIHSAETRTGAIEEFFQMDSFSFNGAAGQIVVIGMSREAGEMALGPFILLFAPDGTLETCAASSPNGCYAAIDEHNLQQSGTYTIKVRDDDGDDTGGYSLSLLLIPGPTVSLQDPDGGDILSGATKTGVIDLNADTDAYTFCGVTAQTAVITMSNGSGFLDAYIALYAPNGILEVETSCPNCCHVEIDHHLLQSGMYTIVVRDYGGNDTGDYSLSLTKIPGPSNVCEGDFNNDGDVDGSDLALFAADFGRTDCRNGPPCTGDFDADGDVDGSDLAVFAADFSRTDCP